MDETFWLKVIKNDYQLPDDQNLLSLTDELLDYLASTDSVLRETFAYNILARWIVLYRYHAHSDLLSIADWLIAQMGIGLGDLDADTVFLRSNAVAVLALIMYRDSQEQFMDELDVNVIADKARQYFAAEQDHRIYVKHKGWANAIANTSDLLKFLAYNTALDDTGLYGLLESIAGKITDTMPMPFMHDEDDRLARVVIAILARNELSLDQWKTWLQIFIDWKTDNKLDVDYYPAYTTTYQNIKHFLRSFLVQIEMMPNAPDLASDLLPELKNTIRAFLI